MLKIVSPRTKKLKLIRKQGYKDDMKSIYINLFGKFGKNCWYFKHFPDCKALNSMALIMKIITCFSSQTLDSSQVAVPFQDRKKRGGICAEEYAEEYPKQLVNDCNK